jgi:ABC-type branched-subunit amino acid transport system ATPase component
VANWAYLLETGRIVESGPAAEVGSKQSVQDVFLGGHA